MAKRLVDSMWEAHERETEREKEIERRNKVVKQVCLWGVIAILGGGFINGIFQPHQRANPQQIEQK